MHSQPLSTVNQATYLGIELTSAHVNKVTNKASQTLGFLRRNIHSASKETKAAAYNTLVRPTLEYSSSAWDPYLKKDIDKIESVQKLVSNNYDKTPGTMTSIMSSLHWQSLESRRASARLTLFYKMVNSEVAVNLNNYVHPYARQSRHYHDQAYLPFQPSNDTFKYSFFPRTVLLWNSLPQRVVSVDTVSGFGSALAARAGP